MYDVAKYAVEYGQFEKLNKARKNIDKSHLQTGLKMDICYTNDYPTVIFSLYKPSKDVPVALT